MSQSVAYAKKFREMIRDRANPFPDRMKAYILSSLEQIAREGDFERMLFPGAPKDVKPLDTKYPQVDKVLEDVAVDTERNNALPAEIIDKLKKGGRRKTKAKKSTRRRRTLRR